MFLTKYFASLNLDDEQKIFIKILDKISETLETTHQNNNISKFSLRLTSIIDNFGKKNTQKLSEILGDEINHHLSESELLHNNSILSESIDNINGIYLYGNVGTGKTMLMNGFIDNIKLPKRIMHFQQFMQDIHLEMHKFKNTNTKNMIHKIINNMSEQIKILCIDELEIKDVADAMIFMNILSELSKHKIFLFITSNIVPTELYLGGIQREYFLPCIEQIQKSFAIFNFTGEKDYRNIKLNKTNVINNSKNEKIRGKFLSPINEEIIQQVNQIKYNICNKSELHNTHITAFGRKTHFVHSYKKNLFTNFDELFINNLSYVDYIAICKKFDVIILENIRKIENNENDIITRFINFIDNIYLYKNTLYITSHITLEEIYTQGKMTKPFKRTISRLNSIIN